MTTQISSYLRSLLQLLELPEGDEMPSGSRCGPSSLVELVQNAVSVGVFRQQRTNDEIEAVKPLQMWQPARCTTSWLLPDADKLYAINLLRKCITTKFQVLCRTAGVPSSSSCRELAEAAEIFNSQTTEPHPVEARLAAARRLQSSTLKQHQLSLGDFVEILVSCRSEFTAEHLLCRCTEPESIVSLARLETQFVRLQISAFNTYSSLLESFSTDEEPLKPYPHSAKQLAVEPLFPAGPTANTLSITANSSFPSATTAEIGKRGISEDVLGRIVQVVVSELWKKVAVCLKQRVVTGGGENLGCLAKKAAQSLAREQDLEAAAKCLQFVAYRATIEKELRNWDKGFQSMLASSQKQGTGKRPSKTVEILCSEVLAPLQRGLSMTTTTDFHTLTPQPNKECLTTCSAILTPLTISIRAASNTLICSMKHSLASSSLPGLARYTFSEGPRVYRGVCEVQQDIRRSLPLTRCQLEYSRGFLEGKRIEANYNSLQATVNYMCEGLERATIGFHDFMTERCKQCLQSVFPSARHWRTVGKQSGEGGSEEPSEYCDVLVEQVLLPLTEAALALEARPQSVFMTLSATIFFTEYRRAILSNKHTYRVPAGRQLQVDCHHLHQWITSEKLGLLPQTLTRLSALHVVTEMEEGLQTLCRTKTSEWDRNNQTTCCTKTSEWDPDSQTTCGLTGGEWIKGLSSLSIWSETAWHSPNDWLECVT